MLSKKFINLIKESTEKAILELGLDLDKIIDEAGKLFNSLLDKNILQKNLTNPNVFDTYSYSTFKTISNYLTDSRSRERFTKLIGRFIYEEIKSKSFLDLEVPFTFEKLKRNLKMINFFFEVNGYVSEAEIDWRHFDIKDLEEGTSHFVYCMKNPIILSSAQKLYSEKGIAQHYSSRTIEAALEEMGLRGREIESFNPNNFSAESVEELWEVGKK